MELPRIRLFLLISLFIIAMLLYGAWQREHPVKVPAKPVSTQQAVPKADVPEIAPTAASPTELVQSKQQEGDLIDIETDVLKVKVDTVGGDIVRAELKKYPQNLENKEQGVVLLDNSVGKQYIAQSGLVGKNDSGPDSKQHGRAEYKISQKNYQLADKQNLDVDLYWENNDGLKVIKTFHFNAGSYLIDVNYRIENPMPHPWQGSFYGQLKQQYTKEKSNGFGLQNYRGGAINTAEKPYKKISFSDMKKAPFKQQKEGGWAAFVEHYFLSAWIPDKSAQNTYYTRVDDNDVYNIITLTPVEVAGQSQKTVQSQLYVGPEIADTLKTISPGLELTIDYGILWPISQLIFWLLKFIHSFVGNWGWSIVLVTLIIKLLFYKLSASSYRSMGKMRKLQPKIESLKEKHGEDKQQFSVALMELYREEKMNPLGGCLPILIQIPVFIALYYVLLESVELRQAPFMFWIKDLSSRDPYFVLPLIMGATMYLQQKMNPTPPDPMQAKVMMFMPFIFTFLFLSFPAGLVLYWTVNNILSIIQQWHITRTLEAEKGHVKGKKARK